jgi:hypothetical protein
VQFNGRARVSSIFKLRSFVVLDEELKIEQLITDSHQSSLIIHHHSQQLIITHTQLTATT